MLLIPYNEFYYIHFIFLLYAYSLNYNAYNNIKHIILRREMLMYDVNKHGRPN